MIWPPPRWMASACRATSYRLNRTLLMFSSQSTPSLLAHWKPATTESLISLRYWTPLVQSTRMLGPLVSGPKHQIFLASVTSYSYLSAKNLPLVLKSSLGPHSPLSMSSARPSGMGTALMNNLLCLLGDLDRHIWLDSSDTVSL